MEVSKRERWGWGEERELRLREGVQFEGERGFFQENGYEGRLCGTFSGVARKGRTWFE